MHDLLKLGSRRPLYQSYTQTTQTFQQIHWGESNIVDSSIGVFDSLQYFFFK